MGKRDSTLVEDMIVVCSQAVGEAIAQQGIRALCRYFGGQMIYIPLRDTGGMSVQRIHRILADATTDTAASLLLEKLMSCYGGLQLYIPLERCAFLKTIALEIYRCNEQQGIPITELARKYNISVNYTYVLWKRGRHEKLNSSLPYLPYLELRETNNPD